MHRSVGFYDALYVALAERLDCPLLTADSRLVAASGSTCPVELLPA
ncbi:MAG: type II toxin-antitoxin system VapC family toxin [Actinomycetota bacterium]|nr:type II toxin-antitoxin system VapC family toxin [Actinomycetota bacterium]